MNKHYFVGIPIPLEVASLLADTRDSWHLHSHKVYSSPEDMHITLLFIGPASEKQMGGLIRDLSMLDQQRFSLTIKGVEMFGNPATPRVVYASVEDEPALFELHRKIVEAAKFNDLGGDLKSLVPHITLAKKWAGDNPLETKLDLSPVSFEVLTFCVFEIQPQRQPKYRPISTINLKGENQ